MLSWLLIKPTLIVVIQPSRHFPKPGGRDLVTFHKTTTSTLSFVTLSFFPKDPRERPEVAHRKRQICKVFG